MSSQRSSKAESESMALELQQVRSKLNKAKKEAYRLEKAIEKKARADAQALNERTASPTSSSETLLGDWVAEERPRAEGMERTWALSRKSSNGSSGSKAESKRSTSSDGRSVLTSLGPSPRRGKQARVFEEMRSDSNQGKLPGKHAVTRLPCVTLCVGVDFRDWHREVCTTFTFA